jgi:hypothetical protein
MVQAQSAHQVLFFAPSLAGGRSYVSPSWQKTAKSHPRPNRPRMAWMPKLSIVSETKLKNEVQFFLDIIGQAKISSQPFFRPQPHTAVMLEVLSMQQRRIFCSCNAQPFCRMPNSARTVPSGTHSCFAHDSECMMRKPTIPVSLVFFQSGPTR